MPHVSFSEFDAEILYSLPRVKSNLNDIIRVFMFIYRSAAPPFGTLDSCFNKSAKAGILEIAGGMFSVDD